MSDTIRFSCPQCGANAELSQVQGDHCPGCNFEFKWFGPGEQRTADDYLHALTRTKHLLMLPDGSGFVIAHE